MPWYVQHKPEYTPSFLSLDVVKAEYTRDGQQHEDSKNKNENENCTVLQCTLWKLHLKRFYRHFSGTSTALYLRTMCVFWSRRQWPIDASRLLHRVLVWIMLCLFYLKWFHITPAIKLYVHWIYYCIINIVLKLENHETWINILFFLNANKQSHKEK